VEVEVLVEVLLVVVLPVIIRSIKLSHTPTDFTLIAVEPFGTVEEVYPASNADLLTPVANADRYPSAFEYKLKVGPVFAPTAVNVINTVIVLSLNY
jgi:hypothetical protein